MLTTMLNSRTPVTTPVVSDFLVSRAAKRYEFIHYPTFPPLTTVGKIAVTLHDLTWWKFPDAGTLIGRTWYRRLMERALRSARLIITHTNTMAADAAEYFDLPYEHFRVVSPGVQLPPAVHGWRVCEAPYILAVGSVEPRKNLAMLVEGFRHSRLASTGVRLVIAGRLAWGEVPPGVKIVSGLSDAQLAACYRDALAVGFASLHEGFGLPPVEALALGTPVACSDLPVLREVTGGHATYFDPHSAESIAAALCIAIRDRASKSAIRDAGRYTWHAAGDQLWSSYRDRLFN